MSKRIALQLYSVREEAGNDYEATIRKVAAMGYPSVQTAGFPGTTPEKAARLFKELGLTVNSAHESLPIGPQQQQVLETMDALGKPALICAEIGPKNVETMDAIKELCDRLNEGCQVANKHGLVFGIHNHWWEFGQVGGRRVHEVMLELLNPEVLFEIDTYWAKVGGADPVAVIKNLGKRAPFLHIKDGPLVQRQPQVAVGDGKMDFGPIFAAALPDAWQIVELDECATDMMQAVKRSYDYLARL
jgi:sugar phosphate isomerase/epimerase